MLLVLPASPMVEKYPSSPSRLRLVSEPSAAITLAICAHELALSLSPAMPPGSAPSTLTVPPVSSSSSSGSQLEPPPAAAPPLPPPSSLALRSPDGRTCLETCEGDGRARREMPAPWNGLMPRYNTQPCMGRNPSRRDK